MTEDAGGSGGPLAEPAPRLPLRTVFARFWPHTRPFRGRMVLSLALTAGVPALTTASIGLFQVLVDDVLTPADFRPFPMLAATYLALTLLTGVVSYVDSYLSAWTAERFVLGLRVELFAHLGELSAPYLDRRPLGDVLSRIGSDVAEIEELVLTGVNLLLTYSFQILFFTTAMLLLDWRLTLVALVAAPAFLLLSRLLSRRIADAAREERRRSGSIVSVAEESLGNAALVHAYGRTAAETARFRAENEAAFRAQMRAIRLESLFAPASGLVQAAGLLLVAGIAVARLGSGELTLGGLLVLLAYLGQLYAPVSGFGNLAATLYSACAGAERIVEVLDARPAVAAPAVARPLPRATGELALHGVAFDYPGSGRPALHEVSFRVPAGSRVAVVGASGAGKSTVVRLLLRQHDPDRGRVTLDGVDLAQLAPADLRAAVVPVLQDSLVFDATVEENIRWARPDAAPEEVEAAARAADLHDVVAALPDGYRTRIGQRGRMLSGGQLRRLAIARALVRDAPVLLLDEPTAGLDAASAARVLAPVRRLAGHRTVVLVTHRLVDVVDADRIVVLDGGRVTGYGDHPSLLRECPGYAALYRLQEQAGDAPPPAPPVAPRPLPARRGEAVARTVPLPAVAGPGVPLPAFPTVGAPSPVPEPRARHRVADTGRTALPPARHADGGRHRRTPDPVR
ncbi:ABC transporter ATP-binding protein [Pseudonocardia spirodelae]|uniref:ABC transporter ATP-binding protein n=1 Tax=Pseudonocardia spirodelae TaxID=3133431 RepID=A0ABU8T6F8_9PSEU